jgi:YD repeat-containing protein
MALVVAGVMAGDAVAKDGAELLGADQTTLRREPQIRPPALGDDPIDELRYGDAAEGIDLVDPPAADSQGDAALELPMSIPPGRGGVQPDLTLSYDSGDDAGWLGTGWDLDLGGIEVDTTYGVPRYLNDDESETYTLDGAQLSPNAVRTEFVPRVRGRAEFTRRVDTEQELIIRHGDNPTNYWWEVRDKTGGVRWYGGHPDLGGPDGDRNCDGELDHSWEGIDENAVLRTRPGGPIFRWALSAKRDVGVNMMRLSYQHATGKRVGAASEDMGRQLYLKEATYTSASAVSCHQEDPAYKVKFLRDDDIDPKPDARKDVIVDAAGGFLQVTSELLRRIEVWTGDPKRAEAPRSFDKLAKAFDLHYHDGAFGKALLDRVDQIGSDGKVFAHNDLDYHDDVRDGSGDYDGFESDQDWDTHDDGLAAKDFIIPFGTSALGSSQSNNGDAHAFLGFSPDGPTKTTSLGGSVSVTGGANQSVVEFLDINGDGLPDKVFRDSPGQVKFRLNRSGPSGDRVFSQDVYDVDGIDNLSTDFGVGVGGGVEAYLGGSVQFSAGADVEVGEEYFEDVNNDGLPDFVTGGTVLFNHLDADGIPSFERSSSATRAPIGVADLDFPHVGEMDELEADQRAGSPLQDTVRRWVAPYAGVIDIDAPVTFDPPPDTRNPKPPAYDGDGVRVTIQRGGDERWVGRLEHPGDSATPTEVDDVHVNKGQAVYFRVQSVDEGVLDQVRWDPRISYDSFDVDDGPGSDVNGRSERVYKASEDFTLAGRPVQTIPAPLEGTIRLDATLTKTKALTDDVSVILQRNGVDVLRDRIDDHQVLADGKHYVTDFHVDAPTADAADLLTLRLEVDSDVDVSALDWRPRLYYTAATKDGHDVPVLDGTGKRTLELPVLPYIDLYPTSLNTAPPEGIGLASGLLDAKIVTTGAQPGTKVTVAVKSHDGLEGKQVLTIDSSEANHVTNGTVDIDPGDGDEHWIEVAFHGDVPREVVDSIVTSFPVGGPDGVSVPHTVRFQGPQGYFPLPYRGWGYVGYSGRDAPLTAPLDESAFEFKRADFPSDPPTWFDDDGSQNPVNGKAYPFMPTMLRLKAADGSVTGTAGVWRGAKDNIVGGAGFARASRRGVDDPRIVQQQPSAPSVGGSVRAPRHVGITAPSFALAAGVGPVGGSLGGAPSFGLLDYTDMNGDGFPDVVSPGTIKFTGPRGAYRETKDGFPAVVNYDTTFALGGGFAGSPVNPKGDSRGEANTPQGAAASSAKRKLGTGSTYSPEGATGSNGALYGFNLGGSFGIEAEFTNLAVPPDWTDFLEDKKTPPQEEDYADVNGDGLPDRITGGQSGVDVELNLGYDFAPKIKWSDGAFESGEAYSGSIGATLGFQYNFKEFAGGLSYNEGVALARYTWADVNGDGVLDRVRKDASEVRVAFGTGAGLMDEVDYGVWSDGFIGLSGAAIPIGEQIAQDQSRGLGGGFDFTFGIGPLCLPTPLCYIIVNPGIHFDHTVANTAVGLTDIDGDGAPDSVRSNKDSEIEVRRNKRGRSNLLRSVHNSLGGELRLGYRRAGNTPAQPESQWTLGSVETDDGRSGEGEHVQLTTFDYSDGAYDPLERQSLGYGKLVEHSRRYQDDGDVMDDPELRSVERTYRNATIFDAGLAVKEIVRTPAGRALRESESTWETAEPENGDAVDARALNADERLRATLSPRRTKLAQRWFADDGSVGEETWQDFRYDELGNIVWQHDEGEPEDDHDDLYADTTPSDCHISMSDDFKTRLHESYGYTCGGAPPAGRTSPLWDPDRCPTWTSIPARFEVHDGDGKLLRSRDGAPALCDNSSMTHLEERTGNGDEVALTELDYDDWGSYNHIVYPGTTDADRLGVDYIYDAYSHGRVAHTFDSHGVTSEATFDPLTGQVASRTDGNEQKTIYSYDPAGRLKSITGPNDQGSGHATVTFDYRNDGGAACVIASHYDPFHPDDPIQTVSFADGLGREIETKRDATIHTGTDSEPANRMVVEDTVAFDAFGQPARTWYPMTEPLGQAHVFNSARTSPSTKTTYTVSGRIADVEHPNGTHTTIDYGFGGSAEVGAQVFMATVTDPGGKPQRSYSDARNNLLAFEERPAGAAVRRTRYRYDALGELASVVEPGGGTTTNTYDLMGRRTSTRTPDAGLREQRYDVASNLVAEITPRLRAAKTQITYAYDRERLTAVRYPHRPSLPDTPDVTYEYGAVGGQPNAVARVVHVVDGARDERLQYDRLGHVTSETSLMKVPGYNVNPAAVAKNTYTTKYSYDTFARLNKLTYPDGEILSHNYDSGGLLKSMQGVKTGESSRTYHYVDKLEYDEFSAERLRAMGNGSRTMYSYYPATRWLARQLSEASGREIQDLNYSYDAVGNVAKLDDQLPPALASATLGPTTQTYEYDPYHRLKGAKGSYSLILGPSRDYAFTNSYDLAGNVASKSQTDRTVGFQTSPIPATTYSTALTYHPERVHQMLSAGVRAPTYDVDGNLTGWPVRTNIPKRTLAWDLAEDMRSAADSGPTGGSSTAYTYDGDGALAIEQRADGVRAFVNDFYEVVNSTKATKYVWAGDARIASKTVASPDTLESHQRFYHEDLEGSVNVVTGADGAVTQHTEYFPSGEPWVRENTLEPLPPYAPDVEPYGYAEGYVSSPGAMSNFGQRWYEPRDQNLTAPDPLLVDDPTVATDDPALLPAYTYAESNPLRLVDDGGTNPTSAQRKLIATIGGLRKPGAQGLRPQVAAFGAAVAQSRARADAFAREAGAGARPGAAVGIPGLVALSDKPADANTRNASGLERLNARLNSVGERLDAYPLIDISMQKTDDGWKLKGLGISPTLGFHQFKVVDRKLKRRQAKGTARSR